jgi:Tol biopolymer transport system component
VLKTLASLLFSCLCFSLSVACSTRENSEKTPPAVSSKPTAYAKNYIAYLHEGNLWAIYSDGTGQRQIAIAPAGEVIQDFLWSRDGKRCYFSVGNRFFDVSLETGNLASGGELRVPPGVTIDHLEMGRDGKTIIVHTLDADAQARLYGVTVGEHEARELSVDDYSALASAVAPVVRRLGDLSVSPDAQYTLFKEVLGVNEELFVVEIATGRRWQVSKLNALTDFEASAEATGGRYILEATWSPDSRYVIFNPAQSCSETGLCYGRLFLVDRWGGPQLQLSLDMMVSIPLDWNTGNTLLAYDDGNEVVLSDTQGQTQRLADGNHPKWQPLAE